MRGYLLKCLLIQMLLLGIFQLGKSIDSLKYNLSLYYYEDLSDTYGGGNLFAGEFGIMKSWFGVSISYGHFQSHSIYNYSIYVEEIGKSIIIPFDEVTIMKLSSLSLKLIPIQNKYIEADFLFGMTFSRAKNSRFNDVIYSYSTINEEFNYLYKDYKLVTRNHFGYQVGFNISFFITKKLGLQINSRIQDLNNGGTFFLVGGGLCFRL